MTGGPKVYIAVSGMSGNGTVIASIPANTAQDERQRKHGLGQHRQHGHLLSSPAEHGANGGV